MKTEYKCSNCKNQLSSREVNTNDDFGIDVGEYECCECCGCEGDV